jgi:hypothetical protein
VAGLSIFQQNMQLFHKPRKNGGVFLFLAVCRESPFSEEISSATNPVKKPARDINKNQLS